MLAIYTFVFSVVFNARWGEENIGKVNFAVILFAGIILSNLFAECINRSPSLVTSNPSYVTKVMFPLEILPWMALFSALIQFSLSMVILLLFCLLSGTKVYAGILLTPIIIMPLLFFIMGMSWFLSALGVYLRDVGQAINMLTTIALFLSPIFYPINALPQEYQNLLALNPLTQPVLQLRDVVLWGKSINYYMWVISFLSASLIFQIGYWWFQKTRQGFADVI